MAPKTQKAEATAAAETLPTDTLAGTRPEAPRPPQGIVFAYSATGDLRKDIHPRWKHVRMIDPDSLVIDGQDPYLALPIDGDPRKVRVRQVVAADAARMLACDPATGGATIFRLATDEEVAEMRRQHDERKANKGQPLSERK